MITKWVKKTSQEPEHDELRGYDDYRVSLGDVMRGERATLAKSLCDVQKDIKISATYIQAIEDCNPEAFASQSFISGYVRSYARYLNLDADWAFDAFCAESGFEISHGMSPSASAKTGLKAAVTGVSSRDDTFINNRFSVKEEGFFSKLEPGALGSLAALMGVVGVVLYGGIQVLNEIQKVNLIPIDQEPILITNSPAISSDQLPETESITLARANNTGAEERLRRPVALVSPLLEPRDGPISLINPASAGAFLVANAQGADEISGGFEASQALSDVSQGTAVQVSENSKEVSVVAVRPTWINVTSSNGTVLFEKILNSGESYLVPDLEVPAVLRTGNAGGTYFSSNGILYGPAGRSGAVKKNIGLSLDDLAAEYRVVDLSEDSIACEAFQVASLADISCN